MSHHDDFRKGYIAGYQSVNGRLIPSIPPTPVTKNGETYYQVGYQMGMQNAAQRPYQ